MINRMRHDHRMSTKSLLPIHSPKDLPATISFSEITTLREAIAKARADKAQAETALAELPAALNVAKIIDDTDALLEKIEAKRQAYAATIEQAETRLPDLENRLFALEDARRNQLLDKHREKLWSVVEKIVAQLETVMTLNEEAGALRQAAALELGAAVSALPLVHFSRIDREGIDHFRNFCERELFGSRPKPKDPNLVVVFFERDNAPYCAGDKHGLPKDFARKLVEAGVARLIEPNDLPPETGPRFEPAPTPDADGRILVGFLRNWQRGLRGANFFVGDKAAFPADKAIQLVRDGIARFEAGAA